MQNGFCSSFRSAGFRRRALFGLLVVLPWAGCSRHEPVSQADGKAPAVQLVRPEKRTISRVVQQPSFVESYERSSVYPKMSAYIEKWNVDIGDRVKKGEVLAKLYVPELVEEWGTKKATVKLDEKRVDLAKQLVQVAAADVQAADAHLSESQAILLQYQAEVDRWNSEVERLAREVNKGVIDPQVLLESKNQLKSSMASREAAKATIRNAQAQLASKKATLEQNQIAIDVASADLDVARSEAKRLEALVGYLVLPAPFDGVVTARNANTFDFVLPATGDPTATRNSPFLAPAGAAPIYVVERTDIVRIFVDVPESDANYVQPGSKATVLIEAFDDEPISATVTRTAWALNVRSRTLRAEIDLPNNGAKVLTDNVPETVLKSLALVKFPETTGQILPGMYAYGNVHIERQGVWTLPNTVIEYSDGKTYYWSCRDDCAARMEVQTGISDGQWVEVLKRRPMGKTDEPWTPIDDSVPAIVIDDASRLSEGAAVRPEPAGAKFQVQPVSAKAVAPVAGDSP